MKPVKEGPLVVRDKKIVTLEGKKKKKDKVFLCLADQTCFFPGSLSSRSDLPAGQAEGRCRDRNRNYIFKEG